MPHRSAISFGPSYLLRRPRLNTGDLCCTTRLLSTGSTTPSQQNTHTGQLPQHCHLRLPLPTLIRLCFVMLCPQNGLIYDSRTQLWHLFAQYNPVDESGSTDQSWLHAVSSDLITWERWDVAIMWGNGTEIWSGSAVLDYNTSGLCTVAGEPCMVAVYCSHNQSSGGQSISIAVSTDADYRAPFHKYDANPVIDIGSSAFRDPAAFWYSTADHSRHAGPRYTGDVDGYWVVVITHSDVSMMEFWTSANLREWTQMSSFNTGNQGNWDCPDFFPIREQSTGEEYWVLTGSYSGTPGGYWVGKWDGMTFTTPQAGTDWTLQDYGVDSYAWITYNNAPNNRRVSVAWLMAWNYAGSVPTAPWRGGGTIPRDLTLHQHRTTNGSITFLLHQLPVRELVDHRDDQYHLYSPVRVTTNQSKSVVKDILGFAGGSVYEINAVLNFSSCTSPPCTAVFLLRYDSFTGQAMQIGITLPAGDGPFVHFMNRSYSGYQTIDEPYNDYWSPPLPAVEATTDRSLAIDVRILLDVTAVEVFVQRGVVAASYQFFPLADRFNYGCELIVTEGEVVVSELDIFTFIESPAMPNVSRHVRIESE